MSETMAKKIFGINDIQKMSLESLRKIYIRLSKAHHPDLVGNSKSNLKKMQDINLAYEVLKKIVKTRKNTNNTKTVRNSSNPNVDIFEYRNEVRNYLISESQVEYDETLNISKNSEYIDLIEEYASIEYDLKEKLLNNLDKMKTVRIVDFELNNLDKRVSQNAMTFFNEFLDSFYDNVSEKLEDKYYFDYLDDYVNNARNNANFENMYDAARQAITLVKEFNIKMINVKVNYLVDEVIEFYIPSIVRDIYFNKKEEFINKSIDILNNNRYEVVTDFKV